jgi:putative molybdopterin biosynthesis protein
METLRYVSKQDQLAAIADGNRLAILRRLMAGPATLTQLATAMGTYPAKVRHHVKQLEAVGLVHLDRVVTTRNYTEKFYTATASAFGVHMLLVPDRGADHPITILGSHDLALELLSDSTNNAMGEGACVPVAIGSLDGLVALRQGLADMAGCHLFDAEENEYNLPYLRHLFPDRPVIAVTLAHREQGLIVAAGNPLGIRSVEDVARSNVRVVNRNPGSGTRTWFDTRLRDLGVPHDRVAGYSEEVSTHSAVADAVASGKADTGLGIQAAAEQRELGFVPLFTERYDLVIDASRVDDAGVARLLDTLAAPRFRAQVRRFAGYDTTETGREATVRV